MKPLTVGSLFSGIGAFERALERLNIDYELEYYCELDKYASTAYSAVHNIDESYNLGDITKIDIDNLPYVDLITHGSPCQDFSIAGKQKGADKGTNTRSSLMWNTVEIIKHTKPKYVIWENVKNVLSDKHIHNFKKYKKTLRELGYKNYSKVINAKHWGIPQNRERIFVVSIRRDIDTGFCFPISSLEGQQSLFNQNVIDIEPKVLRDVLENEVDERYYLKDKHIENFKFNYKSNLAGYLNYYNFEREDAVFNPDSHSPTLTNTGACKDPKIVLKNNELKVKNIGQASNEGSQAGKIYDNNGIFPTVCAGTHGYANGYINEIKPLKRVRTEKAKEIRRKNMKEKGRDYCPFQEKKLEVRDDDITGTIMTGGTKDNLLLEINKLGNIYPSGGQNGDVYSSNGLSPSLRSGQGIKGRGIGSCNSPKIINQYRIRKLTPLECFRLMGFDDEDYFKARKALEIKYYNGQDRSDSQMYKMAGNSIVVNVLEYIFKELFKERLQTKAS